MFYRELGSRPLITAINFKLENIRLGLEGVVLASDFYKKSVIMRRIVSDYAAFVAFLEFLRLRRHSH